MHECPECYAGCYCHGDIDDCLLGTVGGCTHCDDDYIVYGPDEIEELRLPSDGELKND